MDGAGEFSDKLPKCALLFQAVGGRKLPSSRKPLSRSSNRCCLFAPRRTQIPMKMQNTIASGDDDAQPNLKSFQIGLIEAWKRATDEPNSLARALQILDWMIRVYISDSNDLAITVRLLLPTDTGMLRCKRQA